MKSPMPVLLACAALAPTALLATGCGSGGSSSESSSSASPAAGTTTPAGTNSAGASKTGTSSTSKSGGLKATTTPKYAAPPASAPVQSGVVQISYRNIAIDPDTLKVKVGSTIKWTNTDPVEHNVTSEGGPSKFASKNFGEGGTFEFKATKAGVIHYECTLHPTTMNGTIEVVS